jgi:hypothetical protein
MARNFPPEDALGRRAELVGGHLAYPATQKLHRLHLPFGDERLLDLGLHVAENNHREVTSNVRLCHGRAAPNRSR